VCARASTDGAGHAYLSSWVSDRAFRNPTGSVNATAFRGAKGMLGLMPGIKLSTTNTQRAYELRGGSHTHSAPIAQCVCTLSTLQCHSDCSCATVCALQVPGAMERRRRRLRFRMPRLWQTILRCGWRFAHVYTARAHTHNAHLPLCALSALNATDICALCVLQVYRLRKPTDGLATTICLWYWICPPPPQSVYAPRALSMPLSDRSAVPLSLSLSLLLLLPL